MVFMAFVTAGCLMYATSQRTRAFSLFLAVVLADDYNCVVIIVFSLISVYVQYFSCRILHTSKSLDISVFY